MLDAKTESGEQPMLVRTPFERHAVDAIFAARQGYRLPTVLAPHSLRVERFRGLDAC